MTSRLHGDGNIANHFFTVLRLFHCVCRLDEKTKQIIKTWPLTTVRRWAAAPNVFTLDFGDYQDQYYSVQTTEGGGKETQKSFSFERWLATHRVHWLHSYTANRQQCQVTIVRAFHERYLTVWLQRLTANAVVTTVLGSIPATSDTVES